MNTRSDRILSSRTDCFAEKYTQEYDFQTCLIFKKMRQL